MPQLGESVCKASDSKNEFIRGEIVSITFLDTIKACRADTVIDPKIPHWKKGEDLADGVINSKRPAVYLVKKDVGERKAKVTVDIIESNISGDGKLIGRIGCLCFEGKCSFDAGLHENIEVKLVDIPTAISWFRGNIFWGAETSNQCLSLNSTRVELFFIFSTPIDIFQKKKGVWIEALRYLFNPAGANLVNTEKEYDAVAKITRHCHSGKGLKYDSAGGGGSSYNVGPYGGDFMLKLYMSRMHKYANCYDQAAAVQIFAGCLGISTKWILLQPFGYIICTDLLGYGRCNNPFFLFARQEKPWISRNDKNDDTSKEIDINNQNRTGFGNHAFVNYAGKIIDACGGPHIGDEGKDEYVAKSIDKSTILYKDPNAYFNFINRWGETIPPDWKICQGVTSAVW